MMKNIPIISVIMASYNTQEYIAEAIESILNQTFKDFELIIIDDNSKDNTRNIIKTYSKKEKRIKYIFNKNNYGPATSRNSGLKIAKGKYIAILDADDIALPNRFNIQLEYLEHNPDIFLVGSGAININESGEKLSKFIPEININKINKNLPHKNQFYHPSIMFRNEGDNFYRDKFINAQDYDLFLNLLSKGKRLININKILIKYRINPNSISWNKTIQQYLFAKKAREFYDERLKTSKDDYNNFNPDDITNSNYENSNDKDILEVKIMSKFKLNKFMDVRELSVRYFKNYGYFKMIMIYYFASFLGKMIITLLRRIIWS